MGSQGTTLSRRQIRLSNMRILLHKSHWPAYNRRWRKSGLLANPERDRSASGQMEYLLLRWTVFLARRRNPGRQQYARSGRLGTRLPVRRQIIPKMQSSPTPVGGRWIGLFVQDKVHVNSRSTATGPDCGGNITVSLWIHDKSASSLFPFVEELCPRGRAPPDGICQMPPTMRSCSNPYFISASLPMPGDDFRYERKAKGLTGNQVRQVSYGPGPGFFAPRLGLSWQPTGSDKLVLHVGTGIFMNLPDTNRMGSFANNNPVSTQTPNYDDCVWPPLLH